MAIVALATPTLTLGGLTATLGLLGTGTTYGASATGFTVAGNNGLVLVQIVTGSAGGGSLQFAAALSANNPAAITLANSSAYWFGPFDPALYNVSNLLSATLPGATGSTVASFYLPASKALAGYSEMHNPFETVVGAQDY
jgi:hypothetical protein